VTPDIGELRGRIAAASALLDTRITEVLQGWRDRVRSVEGRLRPETVRLQARDARQRLDGIAGSLKREGRRILEEIRARLAAAAGHLDAVSPMATIARGFAVVIRDDGALVGSIAAVSPGDDITVHVSDGTLDAVVEERRRTKA